MENSDSKSARYEVLAVVSGRTTPHVLKLVPGYSLARPIRRLIQGPKDTTAIPIRDAIAEKIGAAASAAASNIMIMRDEGAGHDVRFSVTIQVSVISVDPERDQA